MTRTFQSKDLPQLVHVTDMTAKNLIYIGVV